MQITPVSDKRFMTYANNAQDMTVDYPRLDAESLEYVVHEVHRPHDSLQEREDHFPEPAVRLLDEVNSRTNVCHEGW